MIRVTLDTNLLISALFWRGNPYRILKLCYTGKLDLILSRAIINEFRWVMIREKKFKLSEDDILKHIDIILEFSHIVEPNFSLYIITKDSSDNRILECALVGNSDYIVSGDKHLLELTEYEGTKIVTAAQFLKLFDELRKTP